MERCCKNCFFNVDRNCTVEPGNWDNPIPVKKEGVYHCKEHRFKEESEERIRDILLEDSSVKVLLRNEE